MRVEQGVCGLMPQSLIRDLPTLREEDNMHLGETLSIQGEHSLMGIVVGFNVRQLSQEASRDGFSRQVILAPT